MGIEGPQERNGGKEVEKAPMPMDARTTEFATDFEAPLKEQVRIMEDSKKLLGQLESNPTLKSEAISRVIAKETARYLAAKMELARLQAENEKRLKQHYQ